MTWRQRLAELVRAWLINEVVVTEANDIDVNGFNAADLVVLNAFLDSTYV